jgi:hypothetical protein
MARLEYMIIETEGNKARTELESNVAKAITEGWEPQGGVSISETTLSDYGYVTYSQAMVRRTTQPVL